MLRAFAAAHNAIHSKIVDDDFASAGTTTMMGGFALPVVMSLTQNKWVFVGVNLGDCKAYIRRSSTRKTQEILTSTAYSDIVAPPSKLRDARDPGGRIGKFLVD
jgi:hypothetical protein